MKYMYLKLSPSGYAIYMQNIQKFFYCVKKKIWINFEYNVLKI